MSYVFRIIVVVSFRAMLLQYVCTKVSCILIGPQQAWRATRVWTYRTIWCAIDLQSTGPVHKVGTHNNFYSSLAASRAVNATCSFGKHLSTNDECRFISINNICLLNSLRRFCGEGWDFITTVERNYKGDISWWTKKHHTKTLFNFKMSLADKWLPHLLLVKTGTKNP